MDMVTNGRNLAAKLDSMELPVLYYHVTLDTLVTWIVGAGAPPVVTKIQIPRDTLSHLGEALLESVSSRPGPATPDWLPIAERLALSLIPVELTTTVAPGELLIVADRGLAQVPFALLPLADGTLLGERYAIRYMQGIRTLTDITPGVRFTSAEIRTAGPERVLIAGNPRMPLIQLEGGTIRPTPLPFSEGEARTIADRLGVVPFVGPAATEAALLPAMRDKALIHIATHAQVYDAETQANDSYIVLADGGGADGMLTIGELLQDGPPLRAELVVLSACRTAVGNLRAAEGTMGLQRAFLAKGASSVLVSLWNVQDQATQAFMETFYQEWLDGGATKAEALRAAQTAVRETPGRAHPYFWASFQVFGQR
jgi:CHAT domain-containing protein